jgi:hypothetical protein
VASLPGEALGRVGPWLIRDPWDSVPVRGGSLGRWNSVSVRGCSVNPRDSVADDHVEIFCD